MEKAQGALFYRQKEKSQAKERKPQKYPRGSKRVRKDG